MSAVHVGDAGEEERVGVRRVRSVGGARRSRACTPMLYVSYLRNAWCASCGRPGDHGGVPSRYAGARYDMSGGAGGVDNGRYGRVVNRESTIVIGNGSREKAREHWQ